MFIGVSQITLHLPDSQSLKDKRQIIKSVMARVRNRFEVAIAEVEGAGALADCRPWSQLREQ